jgi:hypothetical protein
MGSGVLRVLLPPNRRRNTHQLALGIPPLAGLSLVCGLLLTLVGLAVTGSDQAYRAISTGQLNALPRLHLRPIDVVVFHGPDGETLF